MYIPIVKPSSSSSGIMVDHNSMIFNRYALKWQSKGGKTLNTIYSSRTSYLP